MDMRPVKTALWENSASFWCFCIFLYPVLDDIMHSTNERNLSFHVDPIVKVRLLAQAPVGNGGIRVYENLSIQKTTVKNIRAGK